MGKNTFPDHHVKEHISSKRASGHIKIHRLLTQLSHPGESACPNKWYPGYNRVWIINDGRKCAFVKLFKSAPCKRYRRRIILNPRKNWKDDHSTSRPNISFHFIFSNLCNDFRFSLCFWLIFRKSSKGVSG